MLKKIISILVIFLPTFSYILFAQILFPNKYEGFNEVYSAEIITVENSTSDDIKIFEPYVDDGYYYVEIISNPDIVINLYSDGEELIYANGVNVVDDYLTVATSENNILLESTSKINISGSVITQEINEATVADNVSISVGTILGLLILLLIIKSKFSTNTKITISLAVATVVFYLLTSIVNDIYWVLITADVGWLASIGINAIPSKKERKTKNRTEKLDDFLGNV